MMNGTKLKYIAALVKVYEKKIDEIRKSDPRLLYFAVSDITRFSDLPRMTVYRLTKELLDLELIKDTKMALPWGGNSGGPQSRIFTIDERLITEEISIPDKNTKEFKPKRVRKVMNARDTKRNIELRNELAEAILAADEDFTINDLLGATTLKKPTIRKYVALLVDEGMLAIAEKGRGKASETKYRLNQEV